MHMHVNRASAGTPIEDEAEAIEDVLHPLPSNNMIEYRSIQEQS